MSSPYDRARDKRRLPADNWLERRKQGLLAQQGNFNTTLEAIGRMAPLSLDGMISTNLVRESKSDLDSVNPSQELGRLSIGIMPTGMPRNWSGHGIWTPDVAMGVNIDLLDKYDYSGPSDARPRPLGVVSLVIGVHTWGRLSDEDMTDIAALNGTWAEYRNQGFSRNGTYVQVRREPGQKVTSTELDVIFAPLSSHIVDYPDIMGYSEYANRQPAGNFSDRAAEPYRGEQSPPPNQSIASLGLAVLPPS